MGSISTTQATSCPNWRSRYPRLAKIFGIIVAGLLIVRAIFPERPPPLAQSSQFISVDRVIDGDTLLVSGGFRVRLLGVNTPETKHPLSPPEPWGQEAFEMTQALALDQLVVLELDRERWDDYRRTLAYVYLDDRSMLNEQLISRGLSPAVVTFPIRSDRRRLFLSAEALAQQKRINLWSGSKLGVKP